MQENNAIVHLELFRYQLLPRIRGVQAELFADPALRGISTIEELKQRKNELFDRVLEEFPLIARGERRLNRRITLREAPWTVAVANIEKRLRRDRKDFKTERLDTWPHVVLIVNNDPSVQLIAISRNTKAFSSGKVVAKALETSFNHVLERFQLSMHVEALFEKTDFWQIVGANVGRIQSVRFELISPNMANMSKVLTLDLRALNAATNSHETDIQLNSAPEGALEINPNDEMVQGLVGYAAEGGGDIVLRIRGLRSRIRTSKSVLELSADELSIENPSKEFLEHLFGKLK